MVARCDQWTRAMARSPRGGVWSFPAPPPLLGLLAGPVRAAAGGHGVKRGTGLFQGWPVRSEENRKGLRRLRDGMFDLSPSVSALCFQNQFPKNIFRQKFSGEHPWRHLARENMEEWGASFPVVLDTIRVAVKACQATPTKDIFDTHRHSCWVIQAP